MTALRLTLAASFVLLAAFLLYDDNSHQVEGIVLYSDAEELLQPTVLDLQRTGLRTMTNPRLMDATVERGVHVIVLTPATYAGLRQETAARAYSDGTLLVGLDLSVRDLEMLVFGTSTRPERARDELVFSMLYEESSIAGCGASGWFSDRMQNWDVAGFIVHRAGENAYSRAGCARD